MVKHFNNARLNFMMGTLVEQSPGSVMNSEHLFSLSYKITLDQSEWMIWIKVLHHLNNLFEHCAKRSEFFWYRKLSLVCIKDSCLEIRRDENSQKMVGFLQLLYFWISVIYLSNFMPTFRLHTYLGEKTFPHYLLFCIPMYNFLLHKINRADMILS